MKRALLVGLLVGGRATRMGGAAKGLFPAPDTGEPLAARLARLVQSAIDDSQIVLVGDAAGYGALDLAILADDPPGQGPLGGLHALLGEGARRDRDVIALACDLPYVTTELVARIATHAPDAFAVAPRLGGLWQPLFARYDASECLPVARTLLDSGRRALHGVLDALGERAVPLPVTAEEAPLLDDWDAPDDMRK